MCWIGCWNIWGRIVEKTKAFLINVKSLGCECVVSLYIGSETCWEAMWNMVLERNGKLREKEMVRSLSLDHKNHNFRYI